MSYDDMAADARRKLGLPPAPPPGRIVPLGNLLDEITGRCPCAAMVTDTGHCTGCGEQVAEPFVAASPTHREAP